MKSLRRVALFCPFVTWSLGSCGIAGWALHWRPFAGALSRYIPMAPLTAALLVLLAAGLFFFALFPDSVISRPALRLVALTIGCVNLAKFLDFVSHRHFGLEDALVAHTMAFGQVQSGRISPIASLFFIALSTAALELGNSNLQASLAGFLSLVVFFANGVVLLGYLYGTPLLYGGHIIPMAFSTSVAFAFLSFAVLAQVNPEAWPLRPFTGTSTKARLLRTFLPVSFATILLDGIFYRLGTSFNPALRSAVAALISAPIMSVIVSEVAVWMGANIDRAEFEQHKAQTALGEAHAQLQEAYDSTLEGWARALELRDKVTEGHCRRVTELTVILARSMGVKEEELIHFRRGAFLHDIGKMGIPDSVLHKPGPLNAEEWKIMRQHPAYGLQILSPIDYLRPTLDIPYCHHEYWNGTGYPRGLKGEQIPLAARIFAVVDVWDALLSRRPYKEGWKPDAVRQHIRSLAGSQLDPQVVDAFLALDVVRAVQDHTHTIPVNHQPYSQSNAA